MSKKDKLISQVKKSIEENEEVLLASKAEPVPLPVSLQSRAEIEGTRRLKNAREIPVDMIKPDPDQPRKSFDQAALAELADSIREHGILQPVTVEFIGDEDAGYYKIISGERRYQAAILAGLEAVPCLTHSGVSSADRFARQLIENLQREDLSPIEKAMSLVAYKNQIGPDEPWESVEKKTGLSRRRRQQFTALLDLPDQIQHEIVETGRRPSKNQITEKHARALLALNSQPDKQLELFNLIKTSGEPLTGDSAIKKAKEMKGAPQFLKFSVSYETEQELLKILQKKVKELKEQLK